jgi:hypothetical protein
MKANERLISCETADRPVCDAPAAPPNNSLQLTMAAAGSVQDVLVAGC